MAALVHLVVDVNLPMDSCSENFGQELSDFVSNLSENEAWIVTVDVNAGKQMVRKGTSDPCVQCTVIGHNLTKEASGKFVSDVTPFFNEKFGISTERIVILFMQPPPGTLVGVNGKLLEM